MYSVLQNKPFEFVSNRLQKKKENIFEALNFQIFKGATEGRGGPHLQMKCHGVA